MKIENYGGTKMKFLEIKRRQPAGRSSQGRCTHLGAKEDLIKLFLPSKEFTKGI